MNKKIVLLSLIIFSISLAKELEFVSHKKEGYLEPSFLLWLKERFDLKIFIETGTYNGKTTEQAAKFFEVYTIELDRTIFENTRSRLANSNINFFHGASQEVLQVLLPGLRNREGLIFWLDAHFCGDETAVGPKGAKMADGITAIREELRAIEQSNIKDCVILIDDIRGFGTQFKNNEGSFIGCWAYPCVQEVVEQLKRINNNFSVVLIGDMLLAYDNKKHSPQFSKAVEACTLSRLYDGQSCSEDELLKAEEVIMNANHNEKAFIKNLYKMMHEYQDPEFHHDLWYGLLCLGEGQYQEALEAFKYVIKRGYKPRRINEYVTQATLTLTRD